MKLDWGTIARNEWAHMTFIQEVLVDDCYQKFFSVEPGDIVVDIGASIGPFTWTIYPRMPQKVYCLEPHPDLFPTLEKNLKNLPMDLTLINKGMGSVDGISALAGLFNENGRQHADGTQTQPIPTIRFDTLIKTYDIPRIDFLKTDCESGEYDMFTPENLPWIKQNVRKIAGEFHLFTQGDKIKFKAFRDVYLKEFSNYHVLSMDYVDMKWAIWDDWFVEKFSAIMIYIDNR
jgi:hypothetical protein